VQLRLNTVLLLAGASFVAIAALPVEPGGPYFENDQVRVFRALEKAHVKGKFHEHKVNRVMVYLQSGRQSFEFQDGRKPQVFDWKEGQVVWSPADGMHSPEVISDSSFNIVEVELKKPGAAKAISRSKDPVKIDPKDYKIEFENDQVRVVRVKVAAHATVPMHEHPLNRATVFLTEQVNRITSSDGKVETVRHKAGDVTWGTPIMHKEENMSDKPFEVVMVEIKS
jgi:quercetin dioxygenase-like cupin family protein